MASREFPLSIVLRTVDRATAGLRRVQRNVEDFGKKVSGVGRTLSTNISAPIAAIGALSAASFARFEQGLSNVSTLIDTNAENLDEMRASVLAIGRRVNVPLEQLTAALYDVRSAGIAASDQFTVLERSAQLAVSGLGTTQQAVDLVTSSINAFGLEGAEAERVYDTIFKTVRSGKTTIDQLSQGFGAVAGTVAATGTQLDEYLASVAALTTTGLPAAQAHTQLRAVISGLTRETETSRRVFRALGARDFKELIKQSGGLVPALQRISDLVGGNEARILQLVGSTEALNAIIGLTGAQADTFTATLASMRDGSDAVGEAFSKQSQTMAASMQRTRNALESVGVTIGGILAPMLERLASGLQRAADWFASLDESTQETIVMVGAVVAAIGPVILVLGQMASSVGAVISTIGALLKVFRFLGLALLTNPILLAVAAIAGAAFLIIRHWEPIKAYFRNLWFDIRAFFFLFLDWVKSAFLNFTPMGLIIKHWGPITDFFRSLWDGVTAIFERAWEIIRPIVDKAVAAADKVIRAGKAVASALDPSSSAVAPRPRLIDAVRAGAVERVRRSDQSTTVKVEFANAPRGTRVTQTANSEAAVDLTVGYQMVLP